MSGFNDNKGILDIVKDNLNLLDEISKMLLEKESIKGEDIDNLCLEII